MAKFNMTYDEACVNLVGEKTLSLKVIQPKYVMENTWPMLKDLDEDEAFKFFHYWVSRAIQLYEIEHSKKITNRIVFEYNPDPKDYVVMSYDNHSVRLEALGKTLIFAARFPHFVFQMLIMPMRDLKPRTALDVFHRHASEMANLYEFPDDSIISDYFRDYEYPEIPEIPKEKEPVKSFWSRILRF